MDVYEIVTNRIMEDLKGGIIPWKKPWVGGCGAVKHVGGQPYSLLNQFLLGCSGEWLSFAQAQKEGGRVKPGEKGRIVVFWKWLEKKLDEEDENGEQKIKRIPYLKYNTVFEVSQCEGITRKHEIEKPNPNIAPDVKAEELFANYTKENHITLHNNGDKAFYSPMSDSITVPPLDRFYNVAEYYSTLFHEGIHSTGAHSRLDRDGIVKACGFGSKEYAKEELIAEIGSSMLMNITGLETKGSVDNNTAYIQSWLKALENDKRLIVSASSKAEKAVKFFLGEEAPTSANVEEVA